MNLFDLSDPRPVHFMGIGGAGMSALALIALRRGVAVNGCDADLSGAGDLLDLGVLVHQGHDPSHIVGVRAVIVTAAIPPAAPELAAARAAGVPVVARKDALANLVASARSVAVAGTHGKTTTTVMTTTALTAAGLAPTGLAGGRVEEWGGNALLAEGALFVVEADEFDQAFLALHPTIAIVNNVEADHLECYGSVSALESAFVTFADRAERVLVGADDPGAERVRARLGTKTWTFGTVPADFHIEAIEQTTGETRARITLPERDPVALRLRVPGIHNLRNATAAIGAVCALDGDLEAALVALAEFRGVGRRFERLGEVGGVELVDDYAHHPTELSATLAAARQAFPKRRLVAVFQPHLYSRTVEHGGAMGRALAAADLVVVTEIYGSREKPMPGVSGRIVADAATKAGAQAIFEPDRTAVTRRVFESIRVGDVVVTLGAGDITQVGRELVEWLRAA